MIDFTKSLLLALMFYMIPSVVAYARGHRSVLAIIAVNILLGWSFLGWIIAFVWSLSDSAPTDRADPYRQVHRLRPAPYKPSLRDAGRSGGQAHR